MFVAYDGQGKIVNVAEKKWSKERLRKLKEETIFICPSCSNELELKVGTFIVAHFAHKKSTSCLTNYESESHYHMEGKRDLYEWLQNQPVIKNVQLEPYISEIHQRPDILFKDYQTITAFEYQCSVIDSDLLRKRSLSYRHKNIRDVWIMGAKLLKRTGTNMFQISAFQWLFTREMIQKEAPTLYTYCSNLKSFIIVDTITPFSTRSIIANIISIPMTSISYRELFQLTTKKHRLITAWVNKIRRFRLTTQRKSKEAMALNLVLYQTKQLPVAYLPSLAFLPLKTNYLIESPVYVWQGWILVYIDQLPLYKSITYQKIFHYLTYKISEGRISVRLLPFIETDYSLAIQEYLLQLCRFSILKQTHSNVFIKQKKIKWSANLEELLKNDLYIKDFFN